MLLTPMVSCAFGDGGSGENVHTEMTCKRIKRSKCQHDHMAIYPLSAKRLVEWVELLNIELGSVGGYLVKNVTEK